MDTIQHLSLDGEWEFFYSAQAVSDDPQLLPQAEQFTGKMVTPGYWEDHYDLFDEEDFFGDHARFNPDYRHAHFPMARSLTPHASSSFLIGTGYYRKMISPALPAEAKVLLTVGPAVWGCSVFCNRQFVGKAAGYATATELPLEKYLKPDAENELIVAVCNRHDDGGAVCRLDGTHDGIQRGARPGQHRGLSVQGYQSERGGIGGGVSLKITDRAAIADWFVSYAGKFLHWRVTLRNGSSKRLEWEMRDDGSVIDSGSLNCTADTLEFDSTVVPSHLWSDDDPHLLDLALKLYDGQTLLDSDSRPWGARKFAVNGTNIDLNGTPVYFRGVTEHCYFPKTTNPHFDFDQYMHDLGVLKNAGFNFIRCHTTCPPEPFFDACDHLGIFVQTELPVVWSELEAEEILRMIRRHPSAVILCEGNEKIIDEIAIERLRRLCNTMHEMAPGMLFNPQEAMRGIEYEFTPDQQISQQPFPHDPKRLAATREFSDVYGSLGGYFSYENDQFPGAAEVNRQHEPFQRPCLTHETGILGGYLDLSQEPRYRGTFIGTGLFEAVKEHMKKRGVWHNARLYYERNCLFISSLRKQLFENLRSCSSITGYDFLGGIDTHWHVTGYPCGVFNEFYEEKYGETASDVRRYNAPTVIVLGCGRFRNFTEGTHFAQKIIISHYGKKPMKDGVIEWQLEELLSGKLVAEGKFLLPRVECGTVADAGVIEFDLPQTGKGCAYRLSASLWSTVAELENEWKIWSFPAPEEKAHACRIVEHLSDDDVHFMAQGGKVLLVGKDFPGATYFEHFRPTNTGRALGHNGAIPHEHPIWKRFDHEGFADWQFYPMMDDSTSLIRDENMPEFEPILELIPSYKLVTRKALLMEYRVGAGRLMVCGLRFDVDDPAARWMKRILIDYLESGDYAYAPKWEPEALQKRLHERIEAARTGKKMDQGGRPLKEW